MYSYHNDCCVRTTDAFSSSWAVSPGLLGQVTASGLIEPATPTTTSISRTEWGLPIYCNCELYAQLLSTHGGSDPRRTCTCRPDTGECVQPDVRWSLLALPFACVAALAACLLPAIVWMIQLRKGALPAAVALSQALALASLFTSLLYSFNSPFSSRWIVIAYLVFMLAPMLPFLVTEVLPSVAHLGFLRGGLLWATFRDYAANVMLDLPTSLNFHFSQFATELTETRLRLHARTAAAMQGDDPSYRKCATVLGFAARAALVFVLVSLEASMTVLVHVLALGFLPAFYLTTWVCLYPIAGLVVARYELLTLPPVAAWFTTPARGSAHHGNTGAVGKSIWTPHPVLYHLQALTRLCCMCVPLIAVQAANNIALAAGGIRPAWTTLHVICIAVTVADGAMCAVTVARVLIQHGRNVLAWELPGVKERRSSEASLALAEIAPRTGDETRAGIELEEASTHFTASSD